MEGRPPLLRVDVAFSLGDLAQSLSKAVCWTTWPAAGTATMEELKDIEGIYPKRIEGDR